MKIIYSGTYAPIERNIESVWISYRNKKLKRTIREYGDSKCLHEVINSPNTMTFKLEIDRIIMSIVDYKVNAANETIIKVKRSRR